MLACLSQSRGLSRGAIHTAQQRGVIADMDGKWMVKRLYKRNGVIKLLSENPLNAPIVLEEDQELVIFGVVTYVITEANQAGPCAM